MDTLERHSLTAPRSSNKPLFGLTVLLVEDSRFSSEAARLMCLKSGARLRRADCMKSALRHLKLYRPTIVIIDVGLPDGSGLDLIRNLHSNVPRIPVILGTSGDDTLFSATIQAGANGFLAKPYCDLAQFQTKILGHLPAPLKTLSPLPAVGKEITPDTAALRDDFQHAIEALEDISNARYARDFLFSLAHCINDKTLAHLALDGAIEELRRYVLTLLKDLPAL